MNPLLQFDSLPLFDTIKPEHITPAIDELLLKAREAFNYILEDDFPADWHQIDLVFGIPSNNLGTAWGAVSHLNSVSDTPELREQYKLQLPKLSAYGTEVSSSLKLFKKYKDIDLCTLTSEQKKAHSNALKAFVLGGAELQGTDRETFADIQLKQSDLGQQFSANTLDATDTFCYYALADEVQGIPEDVLKVSADLAIKDGKNGYKLTLKMPCYIPVMTYAESSDLREKMYRGYVTRASIEASEDLRKFDNETIIGKILELRREEAELLGFKSYADVSLETKMAESPEEVLTFLKDLAIRARPFAEKDLEELRSFGSTIGIDDPKPWDLTYIGEKLKEQKFSFSEEELKKYFQLNKVKEGLFDLASMLFNVTIKVDSAPVWHECVSFYRIERDGALVGQFYLDTVARDGKHGGAWMNNVRDRCIRPDTGKIQTPVAYLICNFADSVDGKPALLSHDDVQTLFHEFGHGVHHLLTQVSEGAVSGISGVEWDAVELPSQFMENFCWEFETLQKLTSHVDTGESLPRDLFDKMISAKNFQVGLGTVRQMEMSLFDMMIHGSDTRHFTEILSDVRKEFSVLKPPVWNRSMNTFSHIFAGGYSAGYYSYKWAEVLSADVYQTFLETKNSDGSHSKETGTRWMKEVLEMGGSRTAMESFVAFKGRKPSIDSLLKQQGMI
jgi:oligopeptidase A